MTAFKNRRHGLIWFPSMRGIAYLSVLRECLVLPSVIIVLENELSFVKGLAEEDKINGYSKKYFNINDSIESFAIEFNIPIITTSAHSINDDSVVKELNKTALKYWLFTGGGVLKTKLFESERQFLHIHPGKLPEYRGSTCFYYSLLNNLSLCSSAFFLTPSLDKGTTLVSCDFSLNLTIDDNQQLFMDYILDPWIRAQTLKKVLMLLLVTFWPEC